MHLKNIEQPAKRCCNHKYRNRECEIPSCNKVYSKCQPHRVKINIILTNFLDESISTCVFI